MIHPPTITYKGLTVVLEKPSRFDTKRLISGNSGEWWCGIIQPFTKFNLDIRTPEEPFDFLPGTKVVLALGQGALDRYVPGKSLLTYRGSPLKYNDLIIIPSVTVQDSFDRKNYENPEEDTNEDTDEKEQEKDFSKTRRRNFRFWLYHDTKKAIRFAQFGPRNYPKIEINYCAQAEQLVAELRNKKGGFLVLDIETDIAQNLTCFSFLWSAVEQLDHTNPPVCYVIPFKRYNGTLLYPQIDYAKIFSGLAVAFRDNTVVGHNLSFDLFVLLYKYHIPPPTKIIDTMVAHHRLHPEPEKSLGHCVSLYTDLPYHKDEGVFDPKSYEQEQALWQYNAKDVITTWFIWCGLRVELLNNKGAMESAKQGCDLIRPCLTMSFEGMPVNKEKFISLVEDGDKRVAQFKRVLSLLTKRDFSKISSQRVCKYLYTGGLGLKQPLKDPTNEKQLLKIYVKNPIPSIRLILYTRGIAKGASALRKVRLWRGDRMTTLYKITGTDTFRLASTSLLTFKKSRGYGTNVQNFSKATRTCIEAPKGFLLGQVDQAGAEALAVAYLCNNGRFRSLFTNKIKPHVYVALHIAPKIWADKLGIPDINNFLSCSIPDLKIQKYWKDLEFIIKDSDNESDPKKRYYYIAKTCCHLLNYDAGWAQFQLSSLVKSEGSLVFTDEQSKYYRNLYRDKLFPEITYFHVDVVHELETQNRTLYNLFGYPRKFNAPWDRELFKAAYAFKPQSTIGVLTEIAQTELIARIQKRDPIFKDVSILQNCHDSLLFMAPEDNIKLVSLEVTKHMQRELINSKGEKFIMGTGLTIGKNWGGYNPIKNPEGLKDL